MNEYRITYAIDEGETEQTYITERTEAAARKLFKKLSGGREIMDLELYSTNALATKDQERETLEKIKAMVAELGPQSYLKTAFEGVFEIAEMNIDEAAASRARMAKAADNMAAGADNPGCVLFKDSVALYRAEKARAEAMEQRAAELDALEPKSE